MNVYRKRQDTLAVILMSLMMKLVLCIVGNKGFYLLILVRLVIVSIRFINKNTNYKLYSRIRLI